MKDRGQIFGDAARRGKTASSQRHPPPAASPRSGSLAAHVKACLFALVLSLGTTAQAAYPDTILLPDAGSSAVPLRLHKTGEVERKFLFFSVYKMAHFLELPYEVAVPVHESHAPRAVHLVFQRKISGQRIQQDFLKLLRARATESEWHAIQASAEAYAAPFARGDVSEGDRFELTWTPHGGLVSHFNGQPLSQIDDVRFAQLLWSIWTGSHSVVDARKLLGSSFRE